MIDGQMREVSMRVEGVCAIGLSGLMLVTFQHRVPRQRRGAPSDGREILEETLMRLEEDLARITRQLRALSTAGNPAQHLRSICRESPSASDELAIILQQLESSREELLVLGEELRTLDQENRLWLTQLAQTAADLQHLLESTGLATLFLDRELRIVRFTPQIMEFGSSRTSGPWTSNWRARAAAGTS